MLPHTSQHEERGAVKRTFSNTPRDVIQDISKALKNSKWTHVLDLLLETFPEQGQEDMLKWRVLRALKYQPYFRSLLNDLTATDPNVYKPAAAMLLQATMPLNKQLPKTISIGLVVISIHLNEAAINNSNVYTAWCEAYEKDIL